MGGLFFRVVFLSLVTILLTVNTGCASFHDRKVPEVIAVPPLSDQMEPQHLVYTFEAGTDLFTPQDVPKISRMLVQTELEDVFKQSGYFGTINGGTNANIRVEARLVNSGDPAAILPAFITGLTLFIIPCWGTDNYEVTATMHWENKTLEYRFKDSMTSVFWLPMILAAPFCNPINVSEDVRKNLWKNVLTQMYKDGVFTIKKPPVLRQNPALINSVNPTIQQENIRPDTSAAILQKLQELNKLKEAGFLTPQEYEIKRAALVNQL